MAEETYRMGEAASALGVRVETLRRWERDGKLKTKRSSGGQRLVAASEVARLLNERREKPQPTTMSARNHFPGVITAVKKGTVAASVEILSGPHRIVAMITREAVDELGLEPGMHATAAVKATSVMVELTE
jgi:molybdopterin-binding protein